MRLNAAAMCWTFVALATASLCGSLGCSGGDGVPLGGPFGGAVPADVMDAGAETDGDGVLDAGAQTSGSASGSSSQAPTWTQLFNAYFAVGKVGNCALSGCHATYMTSPSAAFSWLQSEQQVGGSQPALANPNSSCLTWLGGDMPPGGPGAEPSAVTDLDLWLKAGAKNN
jgi:hypothetical protein